jgi:hypothetical protein
LEGSNRIGFAGVGWAPLSIGGTDGLAHTFECCGNDLIGVRCLLARSRRLAAGLPTVWEAFQLCDLDAEQVRVIDRVARRATEPAHRAPGALAFQERHRRALADRCVTVVQGVDGIGDVTGEVSAADAAPIDGMLAASARSLGAADPRTEQQRRSAP